MSQPIIFQSPEPIRGIGKVNFREFFEGEKLLRVSKSTKHSLHKMQADTLNAENYLEEEKARVIRKVNSTKLLSKPQLLDQFIRNNDKFAHAGATVPIQKIVFDRQMQDSDFSKHYTRLNDSSLNYSKG